MTTVARHLALLASLIALLGLPVACHRGGGAGGTSSGGERSPSDAGVAPADLGASDGGVVDGGARDASSSISVGDVSIGIATDGGVPDAGAALDAAAPVDAGTSSPWGASRDEACAAPPRPEMNASAQQAFLEGVSLVSRGDLAGAATRFQGALGQDRRAYRAAYNLGVIADRQGREQEAMEYYRQALRIVGSYEDAIDGIVALHLRHDDAQAALEFVAPLAVQYAFSDRIQAAHSRVLGELRRWDEAFREARRGLACNERSVPALTALARAASGQGNEELASWILERLAQIESTEQASPLFAESHFLRGQIARNQPGALDRAIAEFDKAVQLRADYVDARMALGQLLLLSGSYSEAATHLYAAAQAAPWSWQVRLAFADALRSLQRWDAAEAELDAIASFAPDQPEIHYSRGLLLLERAGCLRTGDIAAIPVCQRSLNEFNAYRSGMGPRTPTNDRSVEYTQGLTRILQRLNAARAAAEGSSAQGGAETAADGGTP